MLLGTLGASLLGNTLAGKGIELVMEIKEVKKTTTKRQDYKSKMDF